MKRVILAAAIAIAPLTFGASAQASSISGGGDSTIQICTEKFVTEVACIVGRDWNLDVQRSAVPGLVFAPRGITARFSANDTISGNDGCNQYFGDYAANPGAVTVNNLSSTLMSCGEEVDQAAKAYYGALDGKSSFVVNNHTLVLNSGTTRQLVYTR